MVNDKSFAFGWLVGCIMCAVICMAIGTYSPNKMGNMESTTGPKFEELIESCNKIVEGNIMRESSKREVVSRCIKHNLIRWEEKRTGGEHD
jgi:hypothetical protein